MDKLKSLWRNRGMIWQAIKDAASGEFRVAARRVVDEWTRDSSNVVTLKPGLTLGTVPGIGDALTTDPLSQFAATTSAQLLGVISDETGSGALVFGTSPTLVTPALGTPASGVLTNTTGYPGDSSLTTVGTVTSGNVDAVVSAASLTVAGKIEIATAAETTTGTDATRAVSPDGLSGSVFGQRPVLIQSFDSGTAVATGDGVNAVAIPAALNGMNLISATATVNDKGITGTTDVQIRRRRAGVNADMLSTKITLGDEFFASDGVVDAANDDVNTGDQIYIDVDAVHSGTAPNGLTTVFTFQLP